MADTLKPGKGLHTDLTERNIEFLQECLATLINPSLGQDEGVYSDAMHDAHPEVILNKLKALDGWSHEKDDFGDKVYRSTDSANGELRFTVVLTKANKNGNRSLKLDIRPWIVY
jgi:hypothetical protein